MPISKNNMIRTINFSNINCWSVTDIVALNERVGFPLVPLSNVLVRVKSPIAVKDDCFYKRITLRQGGQGAMLRDEVKGKDIGTKHQFVARSGQLIVSRIDARNGSFGIVPKELDGAIVTNDFMLFNVRSAMPEYILFVLSSNKFLQIWQSQSNGTTNRQRIDEKQFLGATIPLPTISAQKKIVSEYWAIIKKSDVLRERAEQVKYSITKCIKATLGLGNVYAGNSPQIIRMVSFSDFANKWGDSLSMSSINSNLGQGKYPLKTLGEVVRFAKRRWIKGRNSDDKFKYIEIGSVDPNTNVARVSVLNVSEAPSRATQVVRAGDLIIGAIRPYLKKFALIRKDQDGCVCSSGFHVIEADKGYDMRFLLEVMKLDPIIGQFECLMTGALYPAVNASEIKQIKIPFPPIAVQRKLGEKIDDWKNKLSLINEDITKLRQKACKDLSCAIFGAWE